MSVSANVTYTNAKCQYHNTKLPKWPPCQSHSPSHWPTSEYGLS